jgi:hypothetical protein
VTETAVIEVAWEPAARLVTSRLSGAVTVADIERWIAALDAALAQVPDGAEIALLSDLHGYEPAELAAHRRMRDVLPTRLASMGVRTGLADVVGAEIAAEAAPRITCRRVAHVHHDATKMAAYEAQVGSRTERFFSDVASARAWLGSDSPGA